MGMITAVSPLAANDQELLARHATGDREALEELFQRYRAVAYRVAYRLLGQEAEKDEEAAEDDSDDGEEADDGLEDSPKKKRKVVAKAAKAPKAKSRTRTPKVTRMKVVWGVFNNSNQRVATFDYPKRKDADDLASKLTSDKKATHFVQPVKEPMEEKKEKEKEKNPDKK